MSQTEFFDLTEKAENFRARVQSQVWDQDGEELVEALIAADDTVVGVLGQMSVFHGTLPSLVDGIREHGLRGDFKVLQPNTVTTFNELLHKHVNVNHPDIQNRLKLHYFRPGNPIYVTTEKSTAERYGFPESSRLILQGLVHISQQDNTSEQEKDNLLGIVNHELDRLLEGDEDITTAVVELDVAHPTVLPSITNVQHLARLSEAAKMFEPQMIAGDFSEVNLKLYGEISRLAITGVDYVKSGYFRWRDSILSGNGHSIFL